MVTALGATELVNDVGAGRWSVDVLTNDWLLLHSLIISTELQAARASWCLRTTFSAQVWMDLITAGGLPVKKYEGEADAAAAIIKAAKALPPKEVRAADTLAYNLTTGTWLDEALTGAFVDKRVGGRSPPRSGQSSLRRRFQRRRRRKGQAHTRTNAVLVRESSR